MIKRVWSSLPSFREPTFDAVGMGVVLAKRSQDSEETESTNGLGKSTLLRIIQFALGSDLGRDKILSHPDLNGVVFGIDFDINGKLMSVSRNTNSGGKVTVPLELLHALPVNVIEVRGDNATITVDDWKLVLSDRFVSNARLGNDDFVFSPTFREIAQYLVRIGKEAFLDPQQAYKNQSGPSKRLSTSYLLDLNWASQRKLHDLTAERDRVSAALTALREVADVTDEQSIGDLEAERVVLERLLAARLHEVSIFNLRSDYHELEEKLQYADRRLHDLINDNYSDKGLLEYYEQNAAEAPLFDADRPVSILREAGAVFAPQTLRSLTEVAAFHEQIYRNRSEFLSGEIKRLHRKIDDRTRHIENAANDKSSVLKTLSSSGALETLIELQRNTTEMSINLESLKTRIEERKRFDRRKDDLGVEIAAARKLLKQDLDDRRSGIDEAIDLFASYTRWLYGVSGKLGIDVGTAGYRFTFSIERQGSDGVDQMVVFCFDLMVATLRARRGSKFLSLIHDSSVFADVDPRQYGLALQLAAKVSDTEGFQYICCLNEGAVPSGHLGDLDLSSLVRLHLYDDSDEGRLLGIRLPPRERK